jgi:chromosome segregation ATPase
VGEFADMKTAVRMLLGAIGLAPARDVERLRATLPRVEARSAQLEEQVVQLRADAEGWKRRYEEASDGLAGWKQAASKTQTELERLRGGVDRLKADLERAKADLEQQQARAAEWKRRAEAWTQEFHDLRARLENAQRATTSSNEQLMAMEVKLDLIEAAIQVLDTRTREQAVSRSV